MSTVSPPKPTELQNPLIELIYSARALADRLTTIHGEFTHCVCGLFRGSPADHENHKNRYCPVARYYRAVEAVETAVRS